MKRVFYSFGILLFCVSGSYGSNMKPTMLTNLLSSTGGTAVGVADVSAEFCRVGIDSRTVQAGDVFWAVSGEQNEGHDFVGDAVLRGATACVVEAGRVQNVFGPLVEVTNTLEALWKYAAWHRTQQEAMVIGVTGSVGKTTTREMIHAVLSARYDGVQSPKNYNNHYGVPLSVLDIDSSHDFAVLELAASAVGEIRDLASVAAPEIGVVTAIGESHLAGFGSIENIIQAKGELIESLPASGFAVLAGDDERFRSIARRANCPVLFVGEHDRNDVQATDVRATRDHLGFNVDGQRFEVAATGRHNLPAALCAVAIAREIGLSAEVIGEGLKQFTAVEGRCRIHEIGSCTVIDDSYNANPRSMSAACDVLRNWAGPGKRVFVAGDMLELGDRSIPCHREFGVAAAQAGIDCLLVYGEFAEYVIQGALAAGMDQHCLAEFRDFEALVAVLECWLEPGDVVLVKGSRGMKMERVIERLRVGLKSENEQNARRQLRACA